MVLANVRDRLTTSVVRSIKLVPHIDQVISQVRRENVNGTNSGSTGRDDNHSGR